MSFRNSASFLLLSLLLGFPGLLSHAQTPQWVWAQAIASDQHEEVNDLVVDKNTNDVYVAGEWKGDLSATFPAAVYPSTDFIDTYGESDGLVAKYDSTGALLWAFKMGGPKNDVVEAIDIDQLGNIYITGYIGTGTAYFSGTSPHTSPSTLDNSQDEDFFIAKYNSSGAFQWVKRSETDYGDIRGQDVYVTASAVYVCGSYDGWATFGSLDNINNPNGDDAFLIKYNHEGVEQWVTSAGSNEDDFGNGVVADETNVCITGSFKGSNLGVKNAEGGTAESINNMNSGKTDIFLSSFDTDGTHDWSQRISSDDDDSGWGIAMDRNNIYLTGEISDGAVFPGYAENPVSSSGHTDVFISSHSRSNGLTNWVSSLASSNSGDQRGKTIKVNGNGALYVCGVYDGELQFPQSVTLTSVGENDAFFTSYNIQGEFRWATNAGSNHNEAGLGISPGSEGSVYIGGFYDGELTLGPFTLPDENRHNGFLAKLTDTASIVLDTFTVENEDPCSAILLTVGDTCNAAIYDNIGASDSGIPNPGCGNYYGGDVWFKAVVPPSGNMFIRTNTSTDPTYPPVNGWMYRVSMAIYSGTCSSLNLDACHSLNSAYNNRASAAFLYDNTPGDTVWIRVWESYNNENGLFSICVYDPGSYPAWHFSENICSGEDTYDLDTMLTGMKSGFANEVLEFSEVPTSSKAVGLHDGATANLFTDGSWIRMDLGDTIPVGETYILYFRSFLLNLSVTQMTLWESLDNINYYPLSYKPETVLDFISPHYITAEHPTRYLLIENDNAGGGGFAVDAIEYNFRATRGGTWSGPGVSGSTFDPEGLSGSVSITYSVGGSNTFSDSTITTSISNNEAGILSGDTAVCSGSNEVVLRLRDHLGDVLFWESSVDGFANIQSSGVAESSFKFSDLSETTSFRVVSLGGGCLPDTTNSITITVQEMPEANAGRGGELCGNSFQLQAIPSVGMGSWSKVDGPGMVNFSPDATDPHAVVSVDQAGRYVFSWTEVNGNCIDESTATVDFIDFSDIDAGEAAAICGTEYALSASPGIGSGQWSVVRGPGNVSFEPSNTAPSVRVFVEELGTYEFVWEEVLEDCSGRDSVVLSFHKQPTADAGSDQFLEFVFSSTMNARMPESGTGIWSLVKGDGQIEDENDPLSKVSELGLGENEFMWKIYSEVCDDVSDNVVIEVSDIQTSTVITPNGDGQNDYLIFPGVDQLPDTEILIFNRWGTEVYRKKNYQNDWDGRDQKSRELTSDTYYYILKLSPDRVIKSYVEIRR